MVDRERYYGPENAPVLAKSVVLYADLLGVSEKACSPEALQHLKTISGMMGEAVALWENQSEFEFATFSDSTLIAMPIDGDDIQTPLAAVVAAGAVFQATMARKGILMRGGVTIGDLCVQPQLIFGEALVRAAKYLENQIAKFPRIVLDVENQELTETFRDRTFPERLVLEDQDDGWPRIDYLRGGIMYAPMTGRATRKLLQGHHLHLLAEFKRTEPSDPIRAKLEWCARTELNAWKQMFADPAHTGTITDLLGFLKSRWLASVNPGEAVWLAAVGFGSFDQVESWIKAG